MNRYYMITIGFNGNPEIKNNFRVEINSNKT